MRDEEEDGGGGGEGRSGEVVRSEPMEVSKLRRKNAKGKGGRVPD